MINEKNLKKYFKQVDDKITYSDFISKIEEKKELLGDLCDEEMCIQLVLNDLNILDVDNLNEIENQELNDKKKYNDKQKLKSIKDIKKLEVDELVSFYGKITFISDLKEFEKKDGTFGRLINLQVSDNTGKIKVNIWDNKTDIIKNENIVFGSIVNISGFSKKIENNVEININSNGYIGLNDENIELVVKKIKIKDITEDNENIEIDGKIIDILPVKTFTKKDSSIGRLKQLIIGDDSGTIKLNLWDQQIDFNSELKVDDSITLKNINIKRNNYSKNLELSIPSSQKIEKLNYNIEYKPVYLKIQQIKDSMNNINILGKILDISEIRTFTKKDGTEGTVGNILIGDETGKIQLTLWNENTIILDEYNFDDVISITNCSSKLNNYSQQLEIHLNKNSFFKKEDIDIQYSEVITLIKDIHLGHIYNIYGIIREINSDVKQYDSSISTITIEDDSSSIEVIIPYFKKDIISQLKVGDEIKITNVSSKYDDLNNIILFLTSKSIIN